MIHDDHDARSGCEYGGMRTRDSLTDGDGAPPDPVTRKRDGSVVGKVDVVAERQVGEGRSSLEGFRNPPNPPLEKGGYSAEIIYESPP